MPHQCLKCGKSFEEGSTQLLKGCPDCGGNRFFFTKEPLGKDERNTIQKDVGQDINDVLLEMVKEQNPELIDNSGNWIKIKPKDVKIAMKKHLSENKSITGDSKEEIEKIIDDGYRESKLEKINFEAQQIDSPETIDIEKPGKYNIDLKGLLEEEPIIIQKDGTYTIHLPSVFKMIDKNK